MTNNDLQQIDALIKKNLKGFATKKDLQAFTTKKDLERFATKKDLAGLQKEIKNDIDEAVVQVISAVDKSLTPLVDRVEKTEDRLGIISP